MVHFIQTHHFAGDILEKFKQILKAFFQVES
jgi:hypothetical protein